MFQVDLEMEVLVLEEELVEESGSALEVRPEKVLRQDFQLTWSSRLSLPKIKSKIPFKKSLGDFKAKII